MGLFCCPKQAIIQSTAPIADINPTESILFFMIPRLLLLAMLLPLGGCDAVTALLADPKVAQRVADSKAIGSACRYGMRSIEDCYALNEKASKSSVFDGWKEMDQYMRENKIDGVPAKVGKGGAPAEEIIEEKASDEPSKDKLAAAGKAKPKSADKAAH